jgi:hypothetical protein
MLYIALLLIMSGLLLFAYSVISGSVSRSSSPQPVTKPHDDSGPGGDDEEWPVFQDDLSDGISGSESMTDVRSKRDPDEALEAPELFQDAADGSSDDDIVGEYDRFSVDDLDLPDIDLPLVEPVILEDGDSSDNPVSVSPAVSVEENGAATEPADADSVDAVLYEDSSSLIDYANRSGSIDASLDDYRNIRRRGSGSLSVSKNGVNFLMGSKLFRFDFNKFNRVHYGENFIALGIRGGDDVKLFIIDRPGNMISIAHENYQEFLEESGQSV